MYIDPDGQFAFLPILAGMAVQWLVCTAIEAALPYAVAAAEAYAGATVAAVVTGIAEGYTGALGIEALGSELSCAQQIGVSLGMGLAYKDVIKKGLGTAGGAVAQGQVARGAGGLVKRATSWTTSSTAKTNIAKVTKTATENGIAKNGTHSLDALSKATQIMDRGGLTSAGRSLTKHCGGARPGNSLFPFIKGNPQRINIQAQNIVDDILTTPGNVIRKGFRGRFGVTIEVSVPDGRGLVYDTNGKFLFFKE